MRTVLLIALVGCVSAAGPHDSMNVRVHAGSTELVGAVRDTHGQPVSGATLVVQAPGEHIAISGDDGAFRVLALPAGRWPVVVYYGAGAHALGTVSAGADVAITLVGDVASSDPPNRIAEAVPFIDVGTTRQGITITSDRGVTVP